MILRIYRIFLVGLAIVSVIISVQSSNYGDSHMDDLEDAMKDPDSKSKIDLNEEELELYDRDNDGELNHKELANYLRDVLDRVSNKPEPKQDKKSYAKEFFKFFRKWNIKKIGTGAILVLLTVIGFIVFINKCNKKRTPALRRGVPVEDLRAARLRRLGVEDSKPQKKEVNPINEASKRTKNDLIAAQKQKIKEESDSDDEPALCNDDFELKFKGSSVRKRKEKRQLKNANSSNTIPSESAPSRLLSNTASLIENKSIQRPITTKQSVTTTVASNADKNQRSPLLTSKVKENLPKHLGDTKPIQKPDVKKVSPIKIELPYSQVVKLVLSQVLDSTLEVQESPVPATATEDLPLTLNTAGPVKLQLHSQELPVNKEVTEKKVSKILLKRMCVELEPMKYAIKCYDRSTHSTPDDIKKSTNGVEIWKDVTSVIKQECTDTVLQQLVQALESPTSAEEDLWSDFRNSSQLQGPSHYFLNCLAGWSSDGAVVSVELLNRLLAQGKGDPQIKETFLDMVCITGKHIKSMTRVDEIALQCSSLLKGLEILVNQPIMIEFLAEQLEKEARQSTDNIKTFFQEKSLFSSFLSLTTLEAKVTGKSLASEPFKHLPHFPRAFQSDVERVQSQIQDGMHSCQNVVHKVLRRVLVKHQQSALAWLSAIVTANDLRSSALLSEDYDEAISCDGFMMNLCNVLLQLSEPFFVSKGDDKIADIDPTYCVSDACRLDHDNERTLSGWSIGSEGEEKERRTNFILPDELRGNYKLKTEIFHLTHRALHIGLINTIQHYNRLIRQYMILKEMNEGKDKEKYVQQIMVLFVLQWETVLKDAQFMRLCSEFYVTNAVWLIKVLDKCNQSTDDTPLSDEEVKQKQKDLLSSIPEFYVKDMCSWFYYAAINNPRTLKGLKVIRFVDCCAIIMSSKGFIPGPMVASKIVTALLAFADCCSRNKSKENLLETASWGSGIEGDLTACVMVCPKIKERLASALVHTYTSVDVVEGLDVDKEEFDKFTSRSEIVKLLQYLWNDPESRGTLTSRCGNEEVQSFLSAILDSLLYLLNDGLSRLSNVCKLQKSLEDHKKWQELDWEEQEEKTNFLKNEEHVSKSFMLMASSTLSFLEMITEEDKVARCFSRPPLSERAASAIIGFLDSLCGPRRFDLKVKNMEKYSFNPRDLLVKLVSVLLRIENSGRKENETEFVKCMSTHPDYSGRIIEQTLKTLRRNDLVQVDSLTQLESFLTQCEDHRREVLGETSDASSTREDDAVSTKQETAEDNAHEEEGKESASGDVSSTEAMEEQYVNRFKDARFETTELMGVTAFQCFRSQPINQRSATIRALMREITQLKDTLPVHPNSSIFVRQDEDRMDFIRALITGPVDTPYGRGCFVFDVYFPSTYPNVPPLVKLITTGNGTVRFNPNLYADGKVCLSLLGTWHGGDASEKWDSKKSTLYQVLLSIQGMIFIPDPCFNEPGYEGIRGTDEGDALSRQYNATIRLATVRHAMVAQIRQPPAGLEDIVRAHFKLQKEVILREVSEWLHQCVEPEEERRMRRAIEDLKIELEKL